MYSASPLTVLTRIFLKITLHGLPDLVLEILHPAALESRAQISEDLDEMRAQLRKQLNRLRELRVKKEEEPGLELLSLSFTQTLNARQMYSTEWRILLCTMLT